MQSAFVKATDQNPKIPPIIFWSACGFCFVPFLLQMLGVDFSTRGPTPPWDALPDVAARTDMMFYSLSGAFTHTILEWSAFTAAIFTVFLAFNHYSITRDITTPVIGVALFCAGAMDAFHTLAADRLIDATAPNTDLIPFTWAVARIFNALIMLAGVGLFLYRKPSGTAKQGMQFVLGISLVFGIIAYVIIQYCANSANLPQTQYPDSVITRPYDVIPLVLFLIAGTVVYPMFYRAYPSLFAHALILSAVPEVVVELHMAFGSTALFDSHFNVAHFLKIFAYLIPFLGLSLDYVRTYHKEQQHSIDLQEAHLELTAKSEVLSATIEELEQTNRYKSEFLSSMSHELRTPLNSILGFSEILIKRSPENRPEKELNALKTVNRNGKHLLGLIDDILDLSKIDAGKMTVVKTRISIKEVLGTVESQLSPLVGDKDLKINYQLPLKDIFFDSDETKIMQILLNLGSNAVKYTESGQVNVSVALIEDTEIPDALVISFRDTGIGISESDQEVLFSEFGRSDDVKLKGIKGTGLGLLITKRLVELLGGRIELDSVHGEGSEFRVFLPNAWEAKVDLSPTHVEINQDAFVILAVDDDADALEYLEMTFEDVGFTVVSTADPTNALEICKRTKPKVICVDLQMPKKDGVELIREISRLPNLAGVPIVVISGHMDRFDEATEAGAESFLVKPCDQKMLVSHIQNVVLEEVRSVLVVDCNVTSQKYSSEQLEKIRMKAFVAKDCDEALKKLDEFRPSLMVIDLVNLESHGEKLISELAKISSLIDLPVILISNEKLGAELSGDGYGNFMRRASVVRQNELENDGLILAAMKAVTKAAHQELPTVVDEEVYGIDYDSDEGTILVVEDTPDNMELFNWILDSEQLRHEDVVTGQSALDAVKRKQYDLILMDINLPDIDGKDVTKSIREMSNYENTPIIAVTAHAIKTEVQGILDSGVTEIVTKPIDHSELLSVINRHLPG